MSTNQRLPGIWMKLHNRKGLLKLMAIQNVSARRLALAAGWKSHTYMQRLLRGEVNTLETEPAVRIAKFLGVGTDDLFLTEVSSVDEHNAKQAVS